MIASNVQGTLSPTYTEFSYSEHPAKMNKSPIVMAENLDNFKTYYYNSFSSCKPAI